MVDVFIGLVKDQFTYGGKKYALKGCKERESTDVLFDTFGKNWLFGTMAKYVFRLRNLNRERDILKIATYAYLLWLKRGFFIDNRRVVPIDTNVELKLRYFQDFIDRIDWPADGHVVEGILDRIYGIIETFALSEWAQIGESWIIELFVLCYLYWRDNFADVEEHDTDTWNEEKQKR